MVAAARTKTTDCPVCGASESRPLYRTGGYTIVECAACTHAYVEAMPTEAELAELYSETAESFLGSGGAGPMAEYLGDHDDRFFAFHADRLAELARAGASPDTRILDFGCSQGALLATLVKKGYRNVVGFDRSASAAAEGRARWSLDIATGDFAAFVAKHEGTFDIVHAANVLEHVIEPKAILADLRRLMTKSGRLVVSVPNTRSLQVRLVGTKSPVIDPPHHLQYYGPKSFERLVTSSGFTVLHLATDFWAPSSDLYLHMKGVPLWLGRAVRHGMAVPGFGINALKLGGVISVLAK